MSTKIEWTEETWNPIVGCTKISPGCKNCYAESMAHRLHAIGVNGYGNNFQLTPLPERLNEPKKRKKPTVYFVNSMSDLFHPRVTDHYIDQIFKVIKECPQHSFQLLTKRAEIMATYFETRDVPSNAWIGVSVEDKSYGIPRISFLKKVKAQIRFLSIEPLLEDIGKIDLSGIHWVIVGGESGPKARPMSLDWVVNIRQQCQEQGVKFFFKQWGAWGSDGIRRSKKANGRFLEGRTWDEIPIKGVALFA